MSIGIGDCEIVDDEPSFPDSVRVGYRDYRIERWESRASNARTAWGEYCGQTATIRIDETLIEREPVKAANTLLHEIMHACWVMADLADEDKQERIVTVLANQLSQVWRDNPHVAEWLSRQFRQRRFR